MLIAALSGRALAAAARRDGYAPLVADLFGDDDTRALAAAHEVVPGSLARGPALRPLLDALDRLASGRAPIGVVYGGGLEGRPALLRALARYRMLGTPAAAVARVKDPFAFAALCRAAGVPHPEVALAPDGHGDWLEKRAGAAGGVHIRPARGAVRRPRYLQRRAAGRPVSALLLGDGTRAMVLGFSEQWTAPTAQAPFRYGGAARPAVLSAAQEAALTDAATRIAAASGIVGLASADFLMRPDGFDLLEINPRPGATLDVFTAAPLFAWHVAACDGNLPDRAPPLAGAEAAAIIYARRACRVPAGFPWPDWAADRQRAGPVAAGAPIATVRAGGTDAAEARAAAERRAADLLARFEETR
ncbi:MAG TPA: ATP-grasp domain-containing protein [Acetobacteraceae bacterium]|nr:ATP-grasp domain-containing protein [Acetobacteraceae bacterium]